MIGTLRAVSLFFTALRFRGRKGKNVKGEIAFYEGFINVFSRRVTGFHGRAKRFELNFFIRVITFL